MTLCESEHRTPPQLHTGDFSSHPLRALAFLNTGQFSILFLNCRRMSPAVEAYPYQQMHSIPREVMSYSGSIKTWQFKKSCLIQQHDSKN